MRCWVCDKPLPNRQTRWRKLKVFEESSTKWITGKREAIKIVHRKCREDFIIKHKILRAAGHPHMLPPEVKIERAVTNMMIYDDLTNPIWTKQGVATRIQGKSAPFNIIDDIECAPTFDTKALIDAFYTKVIKGGLDEQTATTDENNVLTRDKLDAAIYALQGMRN
jgi:hypothetical protein